MRFGTRWPLGNWSRLRLHLRAQIKRASSDAFGWRTWGNCSRSLVPKQTLTPEAEKALEWKDYLSFFYVTRDEASQADSNGEAYGQYYRVTRVSGANEGTPFPCLDSGSVVYLCPPDSCRGTVDLSQEAFASIADPNSGVINIFYQQVWEIKCALKKIPKEIFAIIN
ncbi:hypothetical protein POTOM_000047 [Populus tomentosa]|uniref:Uncharacterized protein n=1 Tax=Populus tomentosa TaxID=118781 RepID=A0A8X8DFB6_POPTO|nr:hypothetical protein POTOM_000047 [Populus tomentosa]